MKLYHISESGNIKLFEPRWSDLCGASVVWAINDRMLHNYLLPRDCPRVTYVRNEGSSAEDVARYLGNSRAVVAIESRWLSAALHTTLYCYELPTASFRCYDEGAGYHVSSEAVAPIDVRPIEKPILALAERGVELRIMPEIVSFGATIATSSLQFSLIRMRNAISSAPGAAT